MPDIGQIKGTNIKRGNSGLDPKIFDLNKELLDAMRIIARQEIDKAPRDITKNALVRSVNSDGSVNITLEGKEFNKIPNYTVGIVKENDVVKVTYPQNQASNMYVSGGTSINEIVNDINNSINTINGNINLINTTLNSSTTSLNRLTNVIHVSTIGGKGVYIYTKNVDTQSSTPIIITSVGAYQTLNGFIFTRYNVDVFSVDCDDNGNFKNGIKSSLIGTDPIKWTISGKKITMTLGSWQSFTMIFLCHGGAPNIS